MDRANVLLFVLAAAAAVLTVATVFTEYLQFPEYALGLTVGITCVYRVILVFAELLLAGLAGVAEAQKPHKKNETPPE